MASMFKRALFMLAGGIVGSIVETSLNYADGINERKKYNLPANSTDEEVRLAIENSKQAVDIDDEVDQILKNL